ncbi:hypothetical protein [Flaviflexus ciconiae]|uniref:hypothetical protein n=1 Tax=Flaviflexus ciconiae TaxID=2496867 RepID=UPI001D17FF5C|nr:hypothetical protein [Flaviflexus ciconiae]
MEAIDVAVAVQGEEVASKHVDPAQATPGGMPAGAFAVVGDGIGDLLGCHDVLLTIALMS